MLTITKKIERELERYDTGCPCGKNEETHTGINMAG